MTIMAEGLLSKDLKGVVAKIVEAAKAGDMAAARLVLDRVLPARRGARVWFTLPPLDTALDLAGALGSILAAVAGGELTTDEGSAVAGLIESKRKAIETVELEARLIALEHAAQFESGK